MWHRRNSALLTILLLIVLPLAVQSQQRTPWVSATALETPQLHLYFFWSERCPHCLAALPYIQALPERYPWLVVHSAELTQDRQNVLRYVQMAQALGQEARSVPAFMFCGQLQVGYDTAIGTQLEQDLQACYQQVTSAWQRGDREFAFKSAVGSQPLRLPLLGEVNPQHYSLPTLTVLLAGLDSFNPCAFFVLLFLLSLLVHAQHRGRMLVIGGVFVLFSGVIYFMFMAAWLNLFLWLGEIGWVTFAAGLLAVAIAAINIKDYFWLRRGVTLSIPEQAKPNLFQRMRRIVASPRLATMLGGTVLLAIAANSYELLCTAGFPMVYTRLLTLQTLSPTQYYFYLVLYNLVYVIPLVVIVLIFVWTLGARKLQEREGRRLKLLSGLMMLGLGTILVFAPGLLSNVLVAVGLIVGALLATVLIVRLYPSPHETTTGRHQAD